RRLRLGDALPIFERVLHGPEARERGAAVLAELTLELRIESALPGSVRILHGCVDDPGELAERALPARLGRTAGLGSALLRRLSRTLLHRDTLLLALSCSLATRRPESPAEPSGPATAPR